MDRAFESAALVTPPTPPASPSLGYPTNGNPGTGTPATIPGDWWYHMLTEELRNVIVAAGLTPDRTAVNQLLQALPGALASRPEMARSLVGNGYQKLPGGLILQWGSSVATSAGAAFMFPLTFPTDCYAFAVSNNGGASGYNWLITSIPSVTGGVMQSSTATNSYSYIAIGK